MSARRNRHRFYGSGGTLAFARTGSHVDAVVRPLSHVVTPVVEALAAELAGRMRVAKLNVDDNPVTAGRFGIQSIPALLLFKGGREIDRIIGAQSRPEILLKHFASSGG